MSINTEEMKVWQAWLQDYMKKRNGRQETILQLLMEDKREYLLFKYAFENNPELKKALLPTELASLTEFMQRLFTPSDKKDEAAL